jgi:hypothetical protein
MTNGKRYLLHEAIKEGDVAKINKEIEQVQNINEKNLSHETPLGLLIQSCGAQTSDVQDCVTAIAEKMLSAGADPNISTGRDENLDFPLYEAVTKRNLALVALLLEYGAHSNIYASNGNTPLIAAIQNGHKDIVHVLLLKGADPTLADSSGHTPLECVIQIIIADISDDANQTILNYLLQHPAINPCNREIERRGVDALMKYAIYELLLFRKKKKYEARQYTIREVIKSLVLSGFDLTQDSLYYAQLPDRQYDICLPHIMSEINSLKNKDRVFSLLQNEIYPFITNTIRQAAVLKATEQAKLNPITNPQIIKQFLLASAQEKSRIIKHIKQLKSVLGYIDHAITTRFLFSSLPAQEEFRQYVEYLNYIKNNITDYPSELIKSSLLLVASLTFPPEVFQLVLKYILVEPTNLFVGIQAPDVSFSREEAMKIEILPKVRF